MFCTPVSGSRVTTLVAVNVGAESNPGVEIGIGRLSSPLPSPFNAAPVITTSWHSAFLTTRGAIGFAIARAHLASISSTGAPIPML
jgi:hypothetical protein